MPIKPTEDEDAWFHKQEMERLRKQAAERSAAMAVEEKKKLKDLHFMKCPKCGHDLKEFEMKGVRLDRCGNCGGTWFDEGEIDEMLKKGDLLDRVRGFFS